MSKPAIEIPPIASQQEIDDFVRAVTRGDRTAALEFLSKYGSAINEKNGGGDPAIIWAVRENSVEMLELLLKKGAHVNATGAGRMTPLMFAAGNGNKEIVEILLKNGASLDAEDKHDRTALRIAQDWQRMDVIKQLRWWIEQREIARDIADFSPALKRAITATRPPKAHGKMKP